MLSPNFEQQTSSNLPIQNKRLKIAQIAPDFYPVPPKQYGGIERVVYDLTEELVKLGHEVYLYAPEGSCTSAIHIAYEHAGPNPPAIADFVLKTLPEQIDLIHDHTHASVIGLKNLQIPTLCTIHDSKNNPVRNPVYLSRRALEVVGFNQGFYVYNGIDPHEYEYTEQKDDYLLFLGVLNWHKGVHYALDIAERTGQKLILAGPVFNHDYFNKEIEPRIIHNPNIKYIGEVGGKQKQDILKNAKCLLFPTAWEEPFGLVMIEAMACGTPVIALANGAVPEVLEEFPDLICNTVDEMTEKVIKGTFPQAQTLRDYVFNCFTTQLMAKNYVELYNQLIDAGQNQQTISCQNIKLERYQHRLREGGTLNPKELFDYAIELKKEEQFERASEFFQKFLESSEAAVEEKIMACDEAADIFYRIGDQERERKFIFKSFEYDVPRAEFCCRLGYQYLQRNDITKAIFWYKLAADLEKPDYRRGFYYENCWTWLPHIQLCICYFRLGDYEQSYRHNEIARSFQPNDVSVLHNKQLLEKILLDNKVAYGRGKSTVPVALSNFKGDTFRMFLETPGFIEETIMNSGSWEPHLTQLLSKVIRDDSVFLDIGTNIGYHALYVASLNPKVTCICFEPHPAIYNQLKRNIDSNGFDNIISHNKAVGDTTGNIDFYMQNEDSYNRGMSGVHYNSAIGHNFEKIEVEVVTLDDFLDEETKRRISVLKIDTQGFEYQVLSGALDLIQQSQPVIAFEFHDYSETRLQDILDLLPNYKVYKIHPESGEIRKLEEPDPENFLQDYICVPTKYESLLKE